MSINPDVLADALQQLLPQYSETFTKWNAAFDKIVLNGQKEKAKGPYIEFNMVPDGPGDITPIPTGNEVMNPTRRQNSQRANAYAGRMIYSYAVPYKDLDEVSNAAELSNIIKSYPERALKDFHQQISQQLVMGDGGSKGNAGQFFTFNGDGVTYSPNGSAVSGFFEVAAVGSQTNTVFGINRATYPDNGAHHQYRHIDAFPTNGRKQIHELLADCAEQGDPQGGSVDLILADRETYANILEDFDLQSRIPGAVLVDKYPTYRKRGIPFQDAELFPETYLDISAFSTAAANSGVAYFLNTDSWHLFTHGDTDFKMRGPTRIPLQDAFLMEYILHMGMYCRDPRLNGLLTGGASVGV